ncbi:WW domain-containing oxidoreductase-like [Dreissena polymorpha]|uniref:Uncharacterized protein n=1 Tax=Dreissena polymorpha TaxID=45954 RepID=A0A9D4DGA5_DREPO|nr:WW domain-containing oxidoreductase-like [Dreissena polymorpha]KAH3747905.1 hypothetical protein DPMN_182340 [Dreissena polymorpha]
MGGSTSQLISPLPVGRTVIITGGNSGIGYQVAKEMAFMGAKVILAVRTEERGKSAIAKIKADYEERKKGDNTYNIIVREEMDLQYHVCDLASLKSTMQFIDWFKSTGLVCHVLICNACTYSLHEVLTEDKWESTYQVNYLAHFLLISQFLPGICKSEEECRIVIISSQSHHRIHFDADYAATSRMKKFDGFKTYANCKLFQIMLMYSLDKILEHHPKVDVLSVDRGKLDAFAFHGEGEDTSIEGFSCRLACLSLCGKMKDDHNGADTVLYAALDPHLQGLSRGYFLRPHDKARFPSPQARNKELQDFLWKQTIENLSEYLTGDALKVLAEK